MTIKGLFKRDLFWLVLLWIGVSAWHPFFLGFCSDDWILLSRPISLSQSLEFHAPRPLYALFSWSLNLLLRGNVRSWTIASSVIVLITAFCLLRYLHFLLARLEFSDQASSRGALFGVALWLLSPLSVVTTSWPTCTLTLPAFWFLALGTFLIYDESHRKRRCIGAIALMASFLTYEAYIFVFPLTALALSISEGANAKKYARYFFLFLAAFVLTMGYKEICKVVGFGSVHKSFNPGWLMLFVSNILRLSLFLRRAFQPFTRPIYLFGGLFLLCVATLSKRHIPQLFTLLFIAVAGYVSSDLLYASVGYDFAGAGIMSRTMNGPLLYLTISLSGFLAIARDEMARPTRHVGTGRKVLLYGSALCLLANFALAGFTRTEGWVVLWRGELEVLKSIPARVIERSLPTGLKPLVVVVESETNERGQFFQARYELTPAASYYYPALSRAILCGELVFLPSRAKEYRTLWNGRTIEQRRRYDCFLTEDVATPRAVMLSIRKSGDATFAPFPVTKDNSCISQNTLRY